MTSEEKINEIVESNVLAGWDQRHEYSGDFLEGDAYSQNVVDTLTEEGLNTHENWEYATGLFYKLATERGLRFYGG